jgi:glucose dehydrogenase
MTPLPLPFKVGVPGIGGPMITKGGVAFLGAAVDNYIRAYDLTIRQGAVGRPPSGRRPVDADELCHRRRHPVADGDASSW